MSEYNKVDDKELAENILKSMKDHLLTINERIDLYKKTRGEDVRAKYLFEQAFKSFIGEFNYLVWNCSDMVKQYAIEKFASDIAHELRYALDYDDDIKARYLMDKFVELHETFLKDVEKFIDTEKPHPHQPALFMSIETKIPAFVCFKCEEDKVYEKQFGERQ